MTTSSEIVEVKNLAPGSLLDVETKTRLYRIECLGGNSIRISGHPQHCPNPLPALLHGSVDKEGALGLGQIQPGTRMIFILNEDCPVTTSRVLRVYLNAKDSQ